MERIDFYILPRSGDTSACETVACRVAEKAYEQGHRVYIRTRDADQTMRLDELLWTFRQGSFLPHAPAALAEGEPIVLGEGPSPSDGRDLLINLVADLPPDWSSFQRVAEIVDQTPGDIEAARERFRIYREHGHKPDYHRLSGA